LQRAVAVGLAKDDAYFAGLSGALQAKRDRLAAGLASLGLTVLPAKGSYFISTDFRPLGFNGDDVAFCRHITEEAGVTAILMYHLANPHMLTFKYEESDLIQILLFLAVGITTARLTNDADRLRRLALTDDLTGLHNLRSFEEQLLGLVRASRASRTPLVLLVLDVDRLKMLNDRYGHLTGAEAVRTVGHIIGRQLPRDAVGCRYGGDEFVVAVPQSSAFDGYRLADDLCHAVNACTPLLAGQQFPEGTLSISVGVVSASFEHGASSTDPLVRDVESGEAAFRAADAALYRAKSRGRNQVCVA
jgi:diguanylate cyclase (GGDEF)-like protein